MTRFEAQLAILDSKNIICAGYGAVMHVHTLAEEVTLSALLHYYDKKTGKKSRRPPQFAKKGMKIVALIETTAPVCLEPCVVDLPAVLSLCADQVAGPSLADSKRTLSLAGSHFATKARLLALAK